jgi:predicted DNA-binding antitoxin AbrB/MazE fold protein
MEWVERIWKSRRVSTNETVRYPLRKKPWQVVYASCTRYTGAMGSRVVEAEYEKGMLKPSTPLTLRPGERVHLIVMRQADPKRWDLSRLARRPAPDEAVLAEQGLEGWAANLDAEDRR